MKYLNRHLKNFKMLFTSKKISSSDNNKTEMNETKNSCIR